MAVPISQLLQEQSTNPAHYAGLTTGTDKKWARAFHTITKLLVHTSVGEDGQTVFANWHALQPPLADDDLRVSQVGFRPNARRWRLDTEEDCGVWFHTEVSNIVLAAWNDYPGVLQMCQPKAANTVGPIPEMVDVVYALSHKRLEKLPLVIGEWKRNILDFWIWQSGSLGDKGNQVNLSRELRGYAVKYDSPQVFCFDGELLLLLQFRATTRDDLKRRDCEVDCLILPRDNMDRGCTLRYGLYRLMAQGLRRCQGLAGLNVSVNGFSPASREWFSGRPLFRDARGQLGYSHPQDNSDTGAVLDRQVDVDDGSMFWTYDGQPWLDENGVALQDTAAMWGFPDDEAA